LARKAHLAAVFSTNARQKETTAKIQVWAACF